MTTDEALALAWTYLAPNRDPSALFPRGFWPDLARVALEIYAHQTADIVLDFQPTRCTHGSVPEPRTISAPTKRMAKILGAEFVSKLEINL